MPLEPNDRLVIEPNRSGGRGWDQTQFAAECNAAVGIPPGGVVTIAGSQTITGQKTFLPFGSGILGQNDALFGNFSNYGLIAIGNSSWGRTNFNAGSLDLDGSALIFNQALPVTSPIEFAFADATNSIRFAIAVPGVGNATYNPRSLLCAGPAPLDSDMVTVGYWQTTAGIFDNLQCDTSGLGADCGVQHDLEVENRIYCDDLNESTPNAGITQTAADSGGSGDGTCVFDGNKLTITSPRNGFGDSLVIGWDNTGDPTTPEAFVIGRNSVAGFIFLSPNASNPQFIIGDDTNTGNCFIDGNGNKDIRFNTLDTGPNRDNVVIFGYGGINLQDQGGDAIFLRSPAVVAGTYTLTLPTTDGNAGQILENADGAGTLQWVNPPASSAFSGCTVYRADALYSAPVGVFSIPFVTEAFDDGTWHDNVTNNTRLTVPAGISRVKLSGQVRTATGDNHQGELYIAKNGSRNYPGVAFEGNTTAIGGVLTGGIGCETPWLNVIPGDYFELQYDNNEPAAVNLDDNFTWFTVEGK